MTGPTKQRHRSDFMLFMRQAGDLLSPDDRRAFMDDIKQLKAASATGYDTNSQVELSTEFMVDPETGDPTQGPTKRPTKRYGKANVKITRVFKGERSDGIPEDSEGKAPAEGRKKLSAVDEGEIKLSNGVIHGKPGGTVTKLRIRRVKNVSSDPLVPVTISRKRKKDVL